MARPYRIQDPKELDTLTDQYSDEEIHKLTGISRYAVTNARKKFGIKSYFEKTGMKKELNSGSLTHGGRKRIYQFNESFFADVETEAQAYFLGFLFADGCIHSRNKIEITLQESDSHILETLRKELGSCPKLEYREYDVRQNCYRLTLCSKTMYQSLVAWGITEAKTHTVQLQKPVPKRLSRHFLRGFWDGDGWVGESSFSALVASEVFLDQLNSMIYETFGFSLTKVWKKVRDTRYPVLEKNQASRGFIKGIYGNSTIYLHRKYVQFSRYWS